MQHDYLTLGGRVARETITTDGTVTAVLDFIYDSQGRPFALNYSTNGGSSFTTYYYVLNLQGDVVKLISYIPGFEYEEVASYTYDAWGNIISATGEKAELNPLRYRGYYYDTETGFYYLQSRYYDPANHRFINADVYASTDISSALASNMFAYCQNNPVINADPTGEILITTLILGGAALFGIGTAIYTGCKAREAGCDWADTLFYAIGTGLCTFLTIYSLGMTAYGVYYNYCTLNGMTPVTEVGKTSTVYPPNDGFASTPEVTTLEPGTQVDRFGGPNGRYVAPTGTSPEALSLPPDKVGAAITRYTILEPIDTLSGTVAPWFGQPGGGTQYLLPDTISNLLANGKMTISPY